MKLNAKNGRIEIGRNKLNILVLCAEIKADRTENGNLLNSVFGGEQIELSPIEARTIADELYKQADEFEKELKKPKLKRRITK